MQINIRAITTADYDQLLPLWQDYNAFYGRQNDTALRDVITATTWTRLFDDNAPAYGLVAEIDGAVVGLAHYLFDLSTTRIEPTCYMQDLFTVESFRGQGVGRLLINGVYAAAVNRGVERVYWQTHETNATGRRLYDSVAKHVGLIIYSHDVD